MSQATELVFLVEDDPSGGYTAKALGEEIFTEADDLDSLKVMVKDAVSCHFEAANCPKIIRLHIVRDEVFAL
jgi:hypothetical protein